MKRSILITTGMIAGLLFTSTGAFAAAHGDSQRIQPQQHAKSYTKNIRGVNTDKLAQRIQKGVKSGKLTQGEARVAKQGLQSLKATIKVVLKDRKVTKWENSRVQKKNAQLTRKITRLMNNRTVAKRSRSYASR